METLIVFRTLTGLANEGFKPLYGEKETGFFKIEDIQGNISFRFYLSNGETLADGRAVYLPVAIHLNGRDGSAVRQISRFVRIDVIDTLENGIGMTQAQFDSNIIENIPALVYYWLQTECLSPDEIFGEQDFGGIAIAQTEIDGAQEIVEVVE